MYASSAKDSDTASFARIPAGLSTWLDVIRWVSAWLVAAGHVRPLIFQDPSAVPDLGVVWKAFYFVTGFGHQAVIVFFVLSGYLIGGSVLNEVRAGRFRWSAYLVKRVTRLYPVLLVGLVTGGALDLLGLYGWNSFGIYSGQYRPLPTGLDYDAAARLTGITLIGNLLMLQTIHVETFGTNGPLWSLCNEFWYYLMFPAMVLTMRRGPSAPRRLAAAALFALLLVWLPKPIVLYFAAWLLGVVIHYLGRSRLLPLVAAAGFVGALCWARVTPSELKDRRLALDILLALTTAVLIWTLRERAAPRGQALHKCLAGFSYSLYVTHFPAVVLLAAFLHTCTGIGLTQPPGPVALATFTSILALAIAWGYGLSRVTEAHTERVRRAILGPRHASRPLDEAGNSAPEDEPAEELPAPTAGALALSS